MGSGKKIWGRVMEHINIQMETDIKETGMMIFKMVWELIIIQMEIYIKENG